MVSELVGDDLDARKFTAAASHWEPNSEAQNSLLIINDSADVVREELLSVDGHESGKHSWRQIFRDDREKMDCGELPRFEGAGVDFLRLETGSNFANLGDPKYLWATTEDEKAFSVPAHSQLQNRKVLPGGLSSPGGPEENAGDLCVLYSRPSKFPGADHISPLSQSKAAKIHSRRTKKKAMEDILQLHLSKR
ncbi:hypothetical protein Ancab_016281, partial [Ancistrocladus abbreviatus]